MSKEDKIVCTYDDGYECPEPKLRKYGCVDCPTAWAYWDYVDWLAYEENKD